MLRRSRPINACTCGFRSWLLWRFRIHTETCPVWNR
jgi:hypothetical protein